MFNYYYHHCYLYCHNRKQKLYNWAMEKKQKNSHEKIVICNCHCSRQSLSGCNYSGQYNSPRWGLSGGIVLGDNCPRRRLTGRGASVRGPIVQRANCPRTLQYLFCFCFTLEVTGVLFFLMASCLHKRW